MLTRVAFALGIALLVASCAGAPVGGTMEQGAIATPGPLAESATPIQVPAGAEHAALYLEDPTNPRGQQFFGWVTWRVESLPPERGRSRRTGLRADIRIPDRIDAMLTLRPSPSADASTSHRFEITFSVPPRGDIASIPGILMKLSERTKGTPLMGRPIQIGLNSLGVELLEVHRQRNLSLLTEQAWLDIPFVYRDGRRAIVVLEKGATGTRAFNGVLASSGTSDGRKSQTQ
jgi:hypothetical protein